VIRLIVRTLVALAGSAVGLIAASLVLDGVDLDLSSFLVAVVIFTVVVAVLQPFITLQLRGLGQGVLGVAALVATLVSLIVTDLVSDGFSIDGIGTWIVAAIIVWLVSVVAVFVLPFLGLKKYLEDRPATR
jgi:uncharacterized membrane protein YvlD (DUF360 family)